VSCESFERWLDEGDLESLTGEVRHHLATCPRCAALWRAETAMQAALSRRALKAPADFTEHVMSRVAEPALVWTPALPWWIQAAMEPATVLALAIAGLVVAAWEPLHGAVAMAQVIVARGVASLPMLFAPLSPAAITGLEIAAVSLITLGALPLFGLTRRLWTASG
jgi:anti-sigma factor RsiW